jgi:hypothetical protein
VFKIARKPNVIVDRGKLLHNNNPSMSFRTTRIYLQKYEKTAQLPRLCPQSGFQATKKSTIISDEKSPKKFEDAVELSRFLDGGGRFQSHSQQSRRRGISSSLAHCENLIP